MKIAHRRGHNFSSVGARKHIIEEVECDKINKSLGKYLDKSKTNHIDVSPGNMGSKADLKFGVTKANENAATLFASIHMNCSTKEGITPDIKDGVGCEVWVYNDKDFKQAQNVCKALSNLGFIDRGVKINKNFYETSKTKCKAMIIEICFVNSQKDVEIYHKVGHDKIGHAIAQALTGKTITLDPGQSSSNNGRYQVVTESFTNKEYAIEYQTKLKDKGINSFLQWKEFKN